MAGLVSLFGKLGMKNVDPDTATAVRAIIMAVFLLGMLAIQGKLTQVGEILANRKAPTISC